MRRRRIAFAMAVLMTVTSIPMNGLTVYAESQTAAGDPAVVGTADEPLALAAEGSGVSVGELENDVLIADEPEAVLPGEGFLPDMADAPEGDLTVEALEVIEEETEEATETELASEFETAAQTEAVTEAVDAAGAETAVQTEAMTEAADVTESETVVQTEAMTEAIAETESETALQTELMTETALQTGTLEAETEILVSETEGLAELEEVMTEGAEVSAERTPQSLTLSGSGTTVDVVDLYSYLSGLEATVTYGEADTEQVTEWGLYVFDYDPETDLSKQGLQGCTPSGDYVNLKLVDNEGNEVSILYNVLSYSNTANSFPKSGEYVVCAEMPLYSEIAPCQYSIAVNGPEQVSTDLQVGMSADYSVDSSCHQWQKFTAEKAGRYVLKYSNTTGTVPNVALYRETEDGLYRDDSISLGYIGAQKYCTVSLDDGENGYLLLYGDEYNYGSGTVDVEEKKEIQSLSVDAKSVYYPMEMNYMQISVPITVTYTDGTVETLSRHTYTGGYYDENNSWKVNEFRYYTLNADQICLRLLKDGTKIDIPNENSAVITGDYELKAFLAENEAICSTVPITIQGLTESTIWLEEGKDVSQAFQADEMYMYGFEPKVAGKYYVRSTAGGIGSYVYKVEDSKFTLVTNSNGYELEANTKYAVLLKPYNSFSATYTVAMVLKKEITGIAFSQSAYEFGVFDARAGLLSLPITITFQDGTTKELSEWMIYHGYDPSENKQYNYYCINTGENDYINLRLKKEDGSFASAPTYDGPYIYGSYILKAELQSNSQITVECPLTISGIPESSEQIIPGEEKGSVCRCKFQEVSRI